MQSGDNFPILMTSKSCDQNEGIQSQLIAKRQEAKFYVQQVLTDLIALGVLEYDSGFENAINKTFKVSQFLNIYFLKKV